MGKFHGRFQRRGKMKIEQFRWKPVLGWDKGVEPSLSNEKVALVMFFTSRQILEEKNPIISKLSQYYPKAEIIGCSSAGEILDREVTDDSLVITAIQFDKASVKVLSSQIKDASQSETLGKEILQQLPREKLKHAFVLSDGLNIDGAALVKGFKQALQDSPIGVTGGLAADADKFERTSVYCNQLLDKGSLVAVGFYGDSINAAYSAVTGWKAYGPIRTVTKSVGTRIYELDGKPALQLYKEFLGPFAKELPAIGLLYPLRIWGKGIKEEANLARTILGIDEETQSIACAGGIPEGCSMQFMMTNTNALVGAASEAAGNITVALEKQIPELCLLMTCVSRKAIMKQRVEEELEAVANAIGDKTAYTGFYTYGEISPYRYHEECYLQNETMAITALWENK
jgi:hypothetical protein